ncbi:conserved rodent malaria protein, unknown function [Plasmodium chabaudi chabaudi]|uniref:Uncharacterized protein n=1 Tax=Plasmodium chabaudi chabaudi TaxID=31271 RepID=A0A1C6W9L1_PLACU|nr:conserved rodent malaria protein, unknown function [Plasmodium chabaudi chabaudi]
MNTKLYSLFVFVYLLIAYCATVQGKKNVNGKNDIYESNMIKKKSQKNYNKGNKHMQRTDEDDAGNFDINYLYKCVYYAYIQTIQNCVNTKVYILKENNEKFYENKKESTHSVSKMEKRKAKAEKIAKRQKAYAFAITSITALTILYFMRGYITKSLSNPNSSISKLIKKTVDIKNKNP